MTLHAKLTLALTGSLLFVTGCGNDNDAIFTDSGRVQSIANAPDDIGEPISINDGAFVITDTSERSEPLDINR